MCNQACIDFGRTALRSEDVRGARILEVGSLNVNGSLREIAVGFTPSEYVGVDISEGPGVDVICDASELLSKFDRASFDVVISTEMLEHVLDWRSVIENFKALLRPGGVLVLTTRSLGFGYHGYPYDFWRYEPDDLRRVFSDFKIDRLESDPSAPGVFLRATKLHAAAEAGPDLSKISLYSIVAGRRIGTLSLARWRVFRLSYFARHLAGRVLPAPVKRLVKKILRAD